MSAAGIMLVFVIVGLIAILGAGLAAFGAQRLLRQLSTGGRARGAAVKTVSLNMTLLALGLVLLFYAVFAVYRMVFGL